jgi:hypothetical protein
MVHHDTDLYDLKVKTTSGAEVIHTTAGHLFWDPVRRQWVKAAALRKGEPLRTPGSRAAYADGGTTPKVHDGWMWDLTVPGNNDHDFYVQSALFENNRQISDAAAENKSVLVHNDSCPVYRVEGTPNTRLSIDGNGNVSITGKARLWLNFGQEGRAQDYLAKRVAQGMDGVAIKQFNVTSEFLERVRDAAVPESEAAANPGSPIIGDPTKAPDQYGLHSSWFNDLLDNVVPDTLDG